jgi:hypothetical protein
VGRRGKAVGFIRMNLSPAIKHRYIDVKYNDEPAQLWKQIEKDVGAVSALDGTGAILRLVDTKLVNFTSVAEYLTAIDILIQLLDNCGCTQTPACHACWIIAGLPETDDWVHFASTLRAMNCDSPSKIVPLMENHEKDLRRRQGHTQEMTLFAKGGSRYAGKLPTKEDNRTIQKRRLECYACGEEGHKRAQCPKLEKKMEENIAGLVQEYDDFLL